MEVLSGGFCGSFLYGVVFVAAPAREVAGRARSVRHHRHVAGRAAPGKADAGQFRPRWGLCAGGRSVRRRPRGSYPRSTLVVGPVTAHRFG